MKKTGIAATAALALTTLFSTVAMAKPVDITGCTKDGQTATLKVDVEGTVTKAEPLPGHGIMKASLESIVRDAFEKTARNLTADQLKGQEGAEAFAANLQNDLQYVQLSDDASVQIQNPPVTGMPACSLQPRQTQPHKAPN